MATQKIEQTAPTQNQMRYLPEKSLRLRDRLHRIKYDSWAQVNREIVL